MTSIHEIWNETDTWFRDEIQMKAVRAVIADRLADDRYQQECRYLMRLRWHLCMSYQEVSYTQLRRHVSPEKLELLDELFQLIAEAKHDAIDLWIDRCEADYPVIDQETSRF